jgi:signal transduction histidine kinase
LRTFSELLLGQASADPAAQREFLVESKGQIDRLERITNNLLNLSRLEGGLIQLQLTPYKVNDLIQSTLAPLRAIAQDRQLDLRVEWPDAALTIQCDPRQLESALTNLVENALKYTPAGGQVQVGATLVESNLSIWVKDNGPGIASEELPLVFERFHRGRTAGEEGSGLGLPIAQRIVQAHGGQLTVVSQEGVGSRFSIILPLADTG